MYIAAVVLISVAASLSFLYFLSGKKMKFFAAGFDRGFSLSQLLILWRYSLSIKATEPESLFESAEAIAKCVLQLTDKSDAGGTENSASMQDLLSKLYELQISKSIDSSDKKKGIHSTRELSIGQKIVIILPQNGVFVSRIVNNLHELTIETPVRRNKDLGNVNRVLWIKKDITVYLWRKNDANYVFDTKVLASGTFREEPVLYIPHSNNLFRIQKRKTLRAACDIPATLFLLPKKTSRQSEVKEKGYRCMLEDVSTSGALIRIGGKGLSNVKIRLTFFINSEEIVMSGVIRFAEFNETLNQSHLHFECVSISPKMRNKIMAFVYNTMPQEQKYVMEALSQTGADETGD